MSVRDQDRWNAKYAKRHPLPNVDPDEWLVEAFQLIGTASGKTESGQRALDVACGLGHNAIWLAQRSWQTDAVDISTNGLELARRCATANDADVRWILADLDDWTPAAGEYDLVVVFRFLDRKTIPRIVRTGLRPGGWLVYETFSESQCSRGDSHISNPLFTLAPGELPVLFPDLQVVVDREDVLHDRTVQRFLGRRQSDG